MGLITQCFDVFKQQGVSGVVRGAKRRVACLIAPELCQTYVFPRSPQVEAELDEIAARLRDSLRSEQSKTEQANPDIISLLSEKAPWYQRIELPGYGITTTSNPNWVVWDTAPDNSLGGRLSAQEAAILRPQPKWAFIVSRLPEIKGRTILEVGSNCGFSSFEFARLGASRVTGIEAILEDFQRAEVLRGILGIKNVRFVHQDWCLDQPPEEKYDIVFCSEVIGHLLFPFWGIYKMLACSRQFTVIDTGVNQRSQAICSFSFFEGYIRYHSFGMSDRMLTDFLVRCGIEPNAIQKHPYAGARCLYIIDMRHQALKARLQSGDDPVLSGKFEFDRVKGIKCIAR